ncbi:uncharacterized protein LOC142802981 [Rhipicephalus microplus]|uniref:uncharacterized protein LOC142802981 n=1 Tax=Rhipicephalus microplus TaxID=6941 RepID=UPI003F6C18CB
MSLRRLELMACVIGARLAEYVWSEPSLQLASGHIWTDFFVALHCIRGKTRNRDLFISIRVAEICKITKPDSWAHCSSSENPADLLTHGVSAKVFLESDKWLENASPDIRHPILLPAELKLTTLIVQAAHARTLHGGI